MRRTLLAALAGLALAASPVLASAGLGVGDKAPPPVAKETINLSSYSAKDLEGKVVFYEIFRTW